MQTYLFPLWYGSYYVLCIFKCVKHHACLAGSWDSNGRETGFVFSLTEILLLVFLYHYVGLLRELVENPTMFSHFLYIFCAQKAKCTFFSPAQGNARKRKCAKPQCKKQCLLCCRAFSQQTGRQHAHVGKKQRRETHSTHSGVPKDYFCSCQPALSLDNNEGMLLWEAPYVQLHFADRPFATAVLDPLIFQPGSSIF